MWKEPDLQREALVRPDGSFSIPLVGEIDARGKTVADLNKIVNQRLTKFISDPVVTVTIQEITMSPCEANGVVPPQSAARFA